MADRVLRTILSGRDELTGVLAKAAASTRAFEHTVEDANVKAAKSSTVAAQAHKAAAASVVSATRQAHLAVAGMGRDFEREGVRAGGLLAQGVRSGIMRNSPLIIAAVSGALLVGAPLLLGAASTLFGVIGAVAGAQADDVQSAWVGTWEHIKEETISAADVLEPVLIRVASSVTESYDRMMPAIERAFQAVGPQMEDFTDSILQASENALPGLVDAVENSGPAMEGLGDLVESVGTGLSDMFSIMAGHAPAAGSAMTELGSTFENLLPLLGELLGQGAELASDVLPGLTFTTGALLDVVQALGPALPVIVAGFAAMAIGKSIAVWVGGLTSAFAGLAASAGAVGGGFALAAAGAYLWTEAGRAVEDISVSLGRAMEVGGSQADKAGDALRNFANSGIGQIANALPDAITTIELFGYSLEDLIPDAQQAKTAYEEWYRSLDEGARAAEDVAVAQSALQQAVADYGPASSEAAAAAGDLATAQDEVRRIAEAEEMAIRGVTEAMLAQADAVMAATNADYAHRVAMDAANDSFAAMNETIAEYGPNSEEARDAALRFEGDLLRVVAAAGTLAEESLPAAMDAEQRHALSQLAQLDRLRELEAQYGENLPGSLRIMLAELERATSGYDRAALEAAALEAGTKNAMSAMEGLGAMAVSPTIDANDDGIRDKTAGALAGLQNIARQHPTPYLDADDKMLKAKQAGAMAGLAHFAAQRPTPVLNADGGPAGKVVGTALAGLANFGRQRPNPMLVATDRATPTINQVLAKIAAVQSRTVTITTNHVAVYRTVGSPMVASTVATGGAIEGGRVKRFDVGGAVVGPGGPTDDRIGAFGPDGILNFRLSNGEHVLDSRDVALLGGQAGVYAFRNALNAGGMQALRPPTAQPGYGGGGWGGSSAVQVVERNPSLTYVDQRPGSGDTMPKLAAAWREMEFLSGG